MRLSDRIALITGASRGIGRAVAECFAREGAEVILVARTVGGLEEADDAIFTSTGRHAVLCPLDLKEFDKVDQLAATIAQRFGRLDILVGNAGQLGKLTPLAHADPKSWQQVMDINLTANWRLIRAFDPLLRTSEAGRAIFVSSGAAHGAYPYWGPYAVSKAALEMLVKTYAAEMATTRVKANLLDPGAVATLMRATAFPGEDPETLPSPEEILPSFLELAATECVRNGEVVNARPK